MSSPSVLLAAAPPRVRSHPPYVDSLGTEAAEFAASVGLVLDPWQRDVVDVALGVRGDGRWAAFEVGCLVARQNGKGAVLEAVELASLFLFGDRLILHSAHEFKTSAEAFLRVKALIDGSDELTRRVRTIRTSHGEEGIELLDGARLRFVARSRSSGRGFSGDRVILDEAQELPRTAMGALLPTLSARPNPQVIYTGTVPGPENDSAHWASLRDRGRAGGDPTLAWMEWSPKPPDDEDGDYDLDDREAWRESTPALDIRITEETIERERASLGDEEFARERLSIWRAGRGRDVIAAGRWAGLADPTPGELEPLALAVDVSPDRSHSSIAVAGVRPDGRRHVEVVDSRRGTGWLAERLEGLVDRRKPCAVVLDPSGPAGSLIPDLAATGRPALGDDLVMTSAREMAQACGAFYDATQALTVTHFDQPALNAAVGAARKRPLGDAWAWHRKDPSVDITPLVAATLALFGLSTAAGRAKRQRSGRVW